MKAAVIILTWNEAGAVERRLGELDSWSRAAPAVWLVDNASRNPVLPRLAGRFPAVRTLVSPVNLGYAGGINLALRRVMESEAEAVLLLNNDAGISEEAVLHLLEALECNPGVGAVGPCLHEGGRWSLGGRNIAWHLDTRRRSRYPAPDGGGLLRVDYVPGSAALIRTAAFRAAGLLDEAFFFSGELADFCRRAAACGLASALCPRVRARHEPGAGPRATLYAYYTLRNRFLFCRKAYPRRRRLFAAAWAAIGLAMAGRALVRGRPAAARAAWLAVRDGLAGRFGNRNALFLAEPGPAVRLPGPAPAVDVVVPVWNGSDWLPGCLAALENQTFRDFELVLVDNGSCDGSPERAARCAPSARRIEWPRNRGFAAAVNAGFRAGRARYVALLNTDARPAPDWLGNLVRALDAAPPEAGALASKMLQMAAPALCDDCGDSLSWQGAAAKRGHGQPASAYTQPADVFSPCAGAALYRRAFLEALGGFDERFFAYLEDVDLGLRGRLRGYHSLFVPQAEVLHQGHGSGLPAARYVRLMTRNRLLLLFKNLPARLLLRHAASLLYGQVYYAVVYRRPLASLAGYAGVLPLLPHLVRERRRIRRQTVLNLEQIDRLLAPDMPEPPLRDGLRAAWRQARFPRN